MYFREAIDTGVLEITGSTRMILLVCIVASVVLGIYFNPLVVAAEKGAAALFG
jgi:hypothetical protein